jgi:chemotaxis protein methyltransferase WspC
VTSIEQIVRARTGLDPAAIGSNTVRRAAQARMKAVGTKATGDYLRLIQSSRAEWIELLELVVVTETWFYRDREPFEAVVRLAREEWLPGHPAGRMRILSVPCASGEEPYSVVMAMLDAGIPRERFEVHAADISPQAIAQAQRAIFGRKSFRGDGLAFRERYFRPMSEGYALNPEVRDAVRFFEGNVIGSDFLPGTQQFDFVLCRNLLMYFDGTSRTKALNAVHRLLGAAGILLVGAAEQSLALEYGFTSAHLPKAFACRKRSAARRDWSQTRDRALPATGASAIRRSRVFADRGGPPSEGGSLDLARQLADGGELQKAKLACEAHLRNDSTSVQGWYLLGLLRDAVTDVTAIECYRRALYLDPNHYESLMQMALRSERDGDLPRARRFRDRAQRAQNGRISL